MPANRTAAIGGSLATVVGALVTLLGAIDDDRAKAAVLIAAFLVVGAIVIVYLLGHQKHEDRVADGGDRYPFVYSPRRVVDPPDPSLMGPPPGELADDEPGDPDGLPHLPVTEDPPADEVDQEG